MIMILNLIIMKHSSIIIIILIITLFSNDGYSSLTSGPSLNFKFIKDANLILSLSLSKPFYN